jgi:hypothetical protein
MLLSTARETDSYDAITPDSTEIAGRLDDPDSVESASSLAEFADGLRAIWRSISYGINVA